MMRVEKHKSGHRLQNDPNSIDEASDKHDLFEYFRTSFGVDDQVYPFEHQWHTDLMDGTDIYTMEVRRSTRIWRYVS